MFLFNYFVSSSSKVVLGPEEVDQANVAVRSIQESEEARTCTVLYAKGGV